MATVEAPIRPPSSSRLHEGPFVTEPMVDFSKEENARKMRAAIEGVNQTVRRAIVKGVRIGMGTDAGVYPHGRNTEEFHLLVNLGMSPLDALRAGTSVDAELLGIQNRAGTLESGKLADLVVIPGDPIQNIRQVEKVMFVLKEGTIFRDDTKH